MSRTNHWRHTAKPARFLFFDARAGAGLAVFMLHWSMLTFKIAVGIFVVFGLLERFGFTVTVALRWVRSRLAGPIRSARPWWHQGGPGA